MSMTHSGTLLYVTLYYASGSEPPTECLYVIYIFVISITLQFILLPEAYTAYFDSKWYARIILWKEKSDIRWVLMNHVSCSNRINDSI